MSESQQEKSISTRYPTDVLEAMKALAKQHERSFNGEVIWALRSYIEHCRRDNEADIACLEEENVTVLIFGAKYAPMDHYRDLLQTMNEALQEKSTREKICPSPIGILEAAKRLLPKEEKQTP